MSKRFVVWAALAAAAGCKGKSEERTPPPVPVGSPVAKTVEPARRPEPPGIDPKRVERGAYLAKATGCAVCHTAIGPQGPDVAHAYAGGLEMPDTFGTWRTPNITPDKGTGIGTWTDEQIAAAIREGVRPDGSKLFAIMPYANYNRMTDDDVRALVAFLRTIPAVERVVAPNKDLKMPPVDVPRPANQPDVKDDPVKHGEYMASLMLCSHCHWTPGGNATITSTAKGQKLSLVPAAPDKLFSGGMPMLLPMVGTGTLYSRNITSDPETGIGKWTEDQVFTAIKVMQKPDGTTIQGPMLLLQSGWSQLDDADLRAVAAYIKQLPAVKNKVPASTFKPSVQPAEIEKTD